MVDICRMPQNHSMFWESSILEGSYESGILESCPGARLMLITLSVIFDVDPLIWADLKSSLGRR